MNSPGRHHQARLEASLAESLGWTPAQGPDQGYDLASPDGREVLELKLGHLGARDLHAAVVRLALGASRDPRIQRAILVADFPRMGAKRVTDEWRRLHDLLRPGTAQRLALVARAAGDWVVLPEGAPGLDHVLSAARTALPGLREPTAKAAPRGGWTPPRQEVLKVLLDAWLRGEPSLQVGALAQLAGCSLPTVHGALAMLEALGEVVRKRNRSVTLAALPHRSLNEALLAARHTQDRARFVDQSGRPADTAALLRRLEKLAPPNVALGGVIAARAYMPDFNLNGLPRLDVKVLKGDPLAWVPQLDPALRLAEGGGRHSAGPVLVVHALAPRALQRLPHSPPQLPLANRAETLFDLYDLGLVEQAEDFVRALRVKGPAGG